MFSHIATSHKIWQALGIVTTIAVSLATTSAALAGECPVDKIKPNARQMVDYKPVGVTDLTLGSIDLGKQPAHLEGRDLQPAHRSQNGYSGKPPSARDPDKPACDRAKSCRLHHASYHAGHLHGLGLYELELRSQHRLDK
jgi:hypothetical protein